MFVWFTAQVDTLRFVVNTLGSWLSQLIFALGAQIQWVAAQALAGLRWLSGNLSAAIRALRNVSFRAIWNAIHRASSR